MTLVNRFVNYPQEEHSQWSLNDGIFFWKRNQHCLQLIELLLPQVQAKLELRQFDRS